MKRGKEVKLDINPNYKISVGTVDNKNPKSIYISLSAWGQLLKEENEIDYDRIINKIRKDIKRTLNVNLNKEDFYNDKYIVDLDMRSSGISYKKRSFMSCEITLFQKNIIPVHKPKVINGATVLINNLIKECLNKQPYFNFYKTKK
tara:strand:- start:718 stop:1155 length:438 start_codon:yes stop_codon:yes gene_type:complete